MFGAVQPFLHGQHIKYNLHNAGGPVSISGCVKFASNIIEKLDFPCGGSNFITHMTVWTDCHLFFTLPLKLCYASDVFFCNTSTVCEYNAHIKNILRNVFDLVAKFVVQYF